ncbi:MAG: electron transfer flavoprotein subunit beta/FixA family protein [Nitrosomonadales bacterium]|nr:electron transfer flavoprotein subunit beta/FixA family protein [Nitrosomonadales bacterium]
MKILVATKRVQDYNVKVRPKSDGSDVDIDGIKMGINPFDENALEEALRIKEKIQSTEISVVSIGDSKNQDVLRHGLAMGADRAILINIESPLQPLGVAKVLKGLVEKEKPDLILLGKLALDSDAGQTGQMLAGLLNYPQGTFVSKIEINNNKLTITREIDGGTNVLEMNLPAVLTADLRLNEPRFVKLPNLMMARKKKIEEIKSSDLATDTQTNQEILEVTIPPSRKAGIKVKSVKELLDKLKDQEGIKL